MLKKDAVCGDSVCRCESKSILKIESNDSISSSISSISFHSFDSRSNSVDSKSTFVDFKTGNSIDNLYNEEVHEDYKEFIKPKNNYLIIKQKIPLRKKRRSRESSNILSKSPQLSDALRIVENTIKIKKDLYDDYFIGDYTERIGE
tara:strand:- start:7517 stop:7954 length:438 start_codon:yes stop_codon:yes gene_type:complete